jgi:hypothetical protein
MRWHEGGIRLARVGRATRKSRALDFEPVFPLDLAGSFQDLESMPNGHAVLERGGPGWLDPEAETSSRHEGHDLGPDREGGRAAAVGRSRIGPDGDPRITDPADDTPTHDLAPAAA